MAHIYQLNFKDGSFYIGQTANLYTRIVNHISSKGKGSPKLQKAFAESEYIGYEVLAECSEEELNEAETRLIAELNPPLNTLPGGEGLRGLNHPRSIYSKEQVEEVVRLFVGTNISYIQISDITEVANSTVHDIVKQRSHAWATEHIDPKLLQSARDRRKINFIVYDKHNNKYEVTQLNLFEQEHNLVPGTIARVAKSTKSTNRDGWSLTKHKVLAITDDFGESFTMTYPEAKEFLDETDLSRYQKDRILNQQKPSGGWSSEVIEG